jgi:hypothetical protein
MYSLVSVLVEKFSHENAMKWRLNKPCPSIADKVLLRWCIHAEGLTLVVAVLEIIPSSWECQHSGKIYHILVVLYKVAKKGFISVSQKN